MSQRTLTTLSISIVLLLGSAWIQPAQAVTPRKAQIRVSKQQPRFLRRMRVSVKRFWSATRKRTARFMHGLTTTRPVKDAHLQPLKRLLHSGRISQRDYNNFMTAMGHKPPANTSTADKASAARQRIERASQKQKHLRPLVRLIKRGELSDSDVVSADQLLNRLRAEQLRKR